MTAPGTLLDHREIPATIPGSRAWWVHVASEDHAGNPTSTTGVVCAPETPGHDRPVVVWCHGTTGMGDTSVPSAQADAAGELVTDMEPEDLAALTVEAAAMAKVPLAGTRYIPGVTEEKTLNEIKMMLERHLVNPVDYIPTGTPAATQGD